MTLIVDFPQSNSSPHRRERVSFVDQIQVKFIENLSYKHKSDLWYSQRELKSFKYHSALVLHKVKSVMTMAQYAELHVDNTSAFLGLENYLSELGYREITHRRQAVRRTVLLEQQRQSNLNIYDPDTMATVAEAKSDFSRRRAQIIGLIHIAERR